MANQIGTLNAVGPIGERALMDGEVLNKIEVSYQAAMRVQKPRDLYEVQELCLKEAEFAGEHFYYSWLVEDKKSGKMKLIEDLGIHGALCIARNFGNCAAPTEVAEASGKWIFRASFVDLETGFTLSRLFEKSRPKTVGKWDAERWSEMQFQAAQSRAQRGVINRGVPIWLKDQVLETAKRAALKGIGKMGLSVAKSKTIDFFKRFNLNQKALEAYLKKPMGSWTPDDILALRGTVRSIQDGAETVESIFGDVMQVQELSKQEKTIEAFYRGLGTVGIPRDDPDLNKYLFEVAEFLGEAVEKVAFQSGEMFFQEGALVETEVKAFVEKFRERYPAQEKKSKPPKRPKKAQDRQKGKDGTQERGKDQKKKDVPGGAESSQERNKKSGPGQAGLFSGEDK